MFKKTLGIKRLSSRELCTLAMLLSISVIMGMFFTLRIGEGIKIPTKFLPIALSGMLFGPLWGGITGATADLLAYLVNPVGMLMPQITLVEFLYGFTYGLFLKNVTRSVGGFLKGGVTVLFQIVILHFFLTSYFLIPVMGNLAYADILIMRSIPALINLILQLFGVSFIVGFSNLFKQLAGGKK